MSEAKHTPGPWTLQRANKNVVGPNGFSVADFKRGRPEDEANAYLIAAAPDLLTQLSLTAWQLEYIVEMHRDKNNNIPGALAIQCEIKAKNARAAIAKAEGAITTSQRAEK